MRANELLLWLSARREGSWAQFRAAVEELHSVENNFDEYGESQTDDSDFSVHQLRLNFECVAHAEFFERDSKYMWRIAPPVLAVHPTLGDFERCCVGLVLRHYANECWVPDKSAVVNR